MSTEPDTGTTTPTAAPTSDVHNSHSALPAVLDKIGFTRAQFWVLMLIALGTIPLALALRSTKGGSAPPVH